MLVSDEIQLVGVPKGKIIETKYNDVFENFLIENERDLIFLQIDPSPYMARERFMAHKCAMGKA